MGGVRENENFRLNVASWAKVRSRNTQKITEFLKKDAENRIPRIMLAPMTGAVENIGWKDEESFYFHVVHASAQAGIGLSIGDGTPDEKLRFGINAVSALKKKAAVFIKPYPDEKIFERMNWAREIANTIGIDIDSFNILTMRNLVNLEKKSVAQLLKIKEIASKELDVPFAIKGIFTKEDLELVKEVKPDIAYISNHGGRVETRIGSTADFLEAHASELKSNAGELWIDGGIRTPLDVATAMALGADRILVGRPLATALCAGGEKAMCKKALELSLVKHGFFGDCV